MDKSTNIKLLTSIARKNIWRNKSRSRTVILSIMLGTIAGIFLCAMMQGMINQKVKDSIYIENGHLEIISPAYITNEDINSTFNVDSVDNILNKYIGNEIAFTSDEIIIQSMAQTPRANAGVNLIGINPAKEKEISSLYTKILPETGDYFEKETRLPEVIIGQKLANDLKIRKDSHHSKIIFTFTDIHGKLTYLSCRIGGIFKTSNTLFDGSKVFIKQEQLREATHIPNNETHLLKILLNNKMHPDQLKNIQDFKKELQTYFPHLKVLDIKETAPDTYIYQLVTLPMTFVTMFIIYLVIAFGIANTMTMAIMDRIRELGMLRSIGMSKQQIRYLIMSETTILTFIGAFIGIILSSILVLITSHTGLNIYGDAFESFGIDGRIYPSITIQLFIIIVSLVAIVGIVTSLSPINKILKSKILDSTKGILS